MHRRALLAAAASSLAPTLACAQANTERFGAAGAYSAERGGASFLVARNGVILAETYQERDRDWRWPIGTGTRPFMALLFATMVEERLINLDEPVAMTLGDWGAHPVKSGINIRGLLNGTSGLSFRRNDRQDFVTANLLEPSEAPGQSFTADAASYVLLAEIAKRKLELRGRGSDPALYLMERTLAPIGCTPVGWSRGADGAAHFETGAAVSARGWAQAGELIRREGVFRAQQLANESALREATQGSFAETRAGFGLWIAAQGRGRGQLPVESDLWRASSPAPLDLAMAAGEGGQRLYICRSERLVIVRQSRLQQDDRRWSDAQFLSLIWRDLMR